jgi:hypothetical protein
MADHFDRFTKKRLNFALPEELDDEMQALAGRQQTTVVECSAASSGSGCSPPRSRSDRTPP